MPHPLFVAAGEAMPAVPPLSAEYFSRIRNLRREAQAQIDRLIDFLDQLDGDPDFEDDTEDNDLSHDEPALGSVPAMNQSFWATDGNLATHRMNCDCEGGEATDEPHDEGWQFGGDFEPSLGWPEGRNSQVGNHGCDSDREHDPAEIGEPDNGF